MSKAPSEATQIRTLKAQVNQLKKDRSLVISQMDAYRARATKAEQECSEWKTRFGKLLARDEVMP